jgi:hypothetical protein
LLHIFSPINCQATLGVVLNAGPTGTVSPPSMSLPVMPQLETDAFVASDWLEYGRIFKQNHLLSSVRHEIKQLLTVPAASDVPLDTLTDYLASEGLQTYPGCMLDVANGSLASVTQSKVYDIGEGDIDGEADSIQKVDYGHGKHRRIVNKMYTDFWSH